MSQRAVTLNPGGASASLFTRREKRAQRPSRAGKPRMMMNNLCHLRRHCTFVIHGTNFGFVCTFCQATRRHLLITARPPAWLPAWMGNDNLRPPSLATPIRLVSHPITAAADAVAKKKRWMNRHERAGGQDPSLATCSLVRHPHLALFAPPQSQNSISMQ